MGLPITLGAEAVAVEKLSAELPKQSSQFEKIPGTPKIAQDGSSNLVVFASLPDQVFVALFAGVNLVLARLVLGGGSFSALAPRVLMFWSVIALLLGVLPLAFSLPPLLFQAWGKAKNLEFSLEVNKAVLLVLLLAANCVGLLVEQDYFVDQFLIDSLALMALLIVSEQWIFEKYQSMASGSIGFNLSRWVTNIRKLEPYPDHAPTEKICKPEDLKVGELFRVGAGQVIPCDGVIVEGGGELLERRISGFAKTKVKAKGHKIFAGSRVLRGELLAEATALFDDSYIVSFTDHLDESIAAERERGASLAVWESRASAFLLIAALSLGMYFYGTGEGLSSSFSAAAAVLCFSLLLRVVYLITSISCLGLTRAFCRGLSIVDTSTLQSLQRARSLLIDFVEPFLNERDFVDSFEIMDQRLDKDALISVLMGLLGGSDEQRDEVIVSYLKSLVPDPAVHKISDLRLYEGRGISAIVNGVDFSFGSESFLVERGVYLQASEVVVPSASQQVLYVAMGDDPVAYVLLSRRLLSDSNSFIAKLRTFGLKVSLCSTESADKVDPVGKALGLELAQINSGLVPERYIERISIARPSAMFLSGRSDPTLAKEADITLSFFDELRWNLEGTDVVVLRSDLEALGDALELARHFVLAQRLALVAIGLGLIACVASTFIFGLSPGIITLLLVMALSIAAMVVLTMLNNQEL